MIEVDKIVSTKHLDRDVRHTLYYIVVGHRRHLVSKQQWIAASDLFYKVVAGRKIWPMSVDGYVDRL